MADISEHYYQPFDAPATFPFQGTSTPKQPSTVANAEKTAMAYAAPASLEKAEMHRAASALTDLTEVNLCNLARENKCECCHYPFRGPGSQRFPICASLSDLKESGLGFPLFFLMIKVLAALLGIVLCVASVPNLVQNLHAGRQDEWGTKSNIAATSVGGNGKHHTDLSYWPVILNLIALVLLSVCYVALWLTLQRLTRIWNKDVTTPSNFTIVMKNLGPDWSEEELKAFIRDKIQIEDEIVEVADINPAYNIIKLKKVMDEMMELNIRHDRTVLNIDKRLQEERPFRRCCFRRSNCNFHSDFITEHRYFERMDMCKKKWREEESVMQKTGIAFVSLASQKQAAKILKKWEVGMTRQFLRNLCGLNSTPRFNGRNISIKRAPEPTDIIWENLGYSHFQRVVRHVCTMSVVCVILLCSFWIMYGLAKWQNELTKNGKPTKGKNSFNKNMSLARFSSIPVAAVNYIFNIALVIAVRVLSKYERNHTHTDLSLSIAVKLTIVLSLNTLLFPILAHRHDYSWYTAGGLANNIFWIAIASAFVKPILKFFSPMHFWRTWRRIEVRKVIENNTAYVSQAKANSIFQYPEADLASWYSEPMIKFLLTLAYTPLLPIIVPITLLGFLLEYWIDKFYLLKFCGKPRQVNEKIALLMLYFVQPALVLYGISILVFFSNVNDHTAPIGVVAVVISCVFWFCNSLFLTAFFERSKRRANRGESYDKELEQFSLVFGIQTYKKANLYTRYLTFCNPHSAPSEVPSNPAWQQSFLMERTSYWWMSPQPFTINEEFQ